MSHTGDYTRVVSRGAVAEPAVVAPPVYAGSTESREYESGAQVSVEDTPRQLDWHGTRRAARFRIRQGVEIQLDGNPANLVDLSVMGAQVISATILRPNQRVRIIPTDDFVMRLGRGRVGQVRTAATNRVAAAYRAGVEFADADAAAMDGTARNSSCRTFRVVVSGGCRKKSESRAENDHPTRSANRQRRTQHTLAQNRLVAPGACRHNPPPARR